MVCSLSGRGGGSDEEDDDEEEEGKEEGKEVQLVCVVYFASFSFI